eukprot:c19962_g1_i4 orf=458-1159(-)
MRQLMFRVLPRKAFISLLSQMQEQLGAAARRWKVSVATCMRTSILSKFLQLNRAYACLPLRRSRVRKVKLTKLLEDRSNFRPVSLPVELHADQTSEKYLQRKTPVQTVLLRIAIVGCPRTILLLAPVHASAETVIAMAINSNTREATPGRNALKSTSHQFELYCGHCNAPALHPKQLIGTVGSRHFLLCKRPLIYGETAQLKHTRQLHCKFAHHSRSGNAAGNRGALISRCTL